MSTKYQCSSPQHATSPKVTPPQLDGRPRPTTLPDLCHHSPYISSETLLVIGPSAYIRAEPVLPTDS
eukprot:scaffold3087_cov130-Alexandrium_tamarense.AAC.32